MSLQITTKGCYGLRALVDLAKHQSDLPVQLSSVAMRIGVSRKYLHAMLVVLKGVGLIRSIRGSGGGYRLSRDPAEITIAEVLQALEGVLSYATVSAIRQLVRGPNHALLGDCGTIWELL